MIELTINADTPRDLFDKLRELLAGDPAYGLRHEQRAVEANFVTHGNSQAVGDDVVKRTRRTKEQIAADNAASQAESPNGSASEGTRQSSDQGTTQESSSGDSASGQTATTAASRSDGAYDYQTDIKPQVLKVSQKHGRPGVEKLLAPYAVSNAQQIPAEKYAELLAEIDAALADDGYVS